jgi:hypothetical protein
MIWYFLQTYCVGAEGSALSYTFSLAKPGTPKTPKSNLSPEPYFWNHIGPRPLHFSPGGPNLAV